MATNLHVTPIGRVSYPHVFQKHKNDNPEFKDKFEITLLFPKTEPLTTLRADLEAALEAEWPGGKDRPKASKLKMPIKDGDERWDEDNPEKNKEYKDHWYICFKSDTRPAVVDTSKSPITEDDKGRFYSGCYARVSYNCKAYNMTVNKGVSAYLGNVQKTGDGTPFGAASTTVDDDFDCIDPEDLI